MWALRLKRRHSRSFGYSLTRNRPPSGWNFGLSSTTARLTVTMRCARSRSLSPQFGQLAPAQAGLDVGLDEQLHWSSGRAA